VPIGMVRDSQARLQGARAQHALQILRQVDPEADDACQEQQPRGVGASADPAVEQVQRQQWLPAPVLGARELAQAARHWKRGRQGP
jgi:hypothetical protein